MLIKKMWGVLKNVVELLYVFHGCNFGLINNKYTYTTK